MEDIELSKVLRALTVSKKSLYQYFGYNGEDLNVVDMTGMYWQMPEYKIILCHEKQEVLNENGDTVYMYRWEKIYVELTYTMFHVEESLFVFDSNKITK